MVKLELCDNLNCEKAKECYRTVAEIWINGYRDFKNICTNKNNYPYFYEIGDKPVRKEELQNV